MVGMVAFEGGIMVEGKPSSWPRMMCSEAMRWEVLVFSCEEGGIDMQRRSEIREGSGPGPVLSALLLANNMRMEEFILAPHNVRVQSIVMGKPW